MPIRHPSLDDGLETIRVVVSSSASRPVVRRSQRPSLGAIPTKHALFIEVQPQREEFQAVWPGPRGPQPVPGGALGHIGLACGMARKAGEDGSCLAAATLQRIPNLNSTSIESTLPRFPVDWRLGSGISRAKPLAEHSHLTIYHVDNDSWKYVFQLDGTILRRFTSTVWRAARVATSADLTGK
ncbi:uncharacterized protein BCR38DRAFT_405256 [Pseudomassariella vexata]|uniref:Uncharacterized protein n=1 Tax=Pseudomassariella vexata TaxID=1141098 RepID=A0A1Y2EDQ9_9PEZI|nr:uncharacterized protein BCR38DRAFT_405256 [Pseudomassariella vexata]ORY69547.1 hypothetical protein BCR38DRAFT_405256 [Pseudomassariella vexata]